MAFHDHRAPRSPRPVSLPATALPFLKRAEDPALMHRIGMFALAEAVRALGLDGSADSPTDAAGVEGFRRALLAQFPDASQAQFTDACAYAAALVTKTWNEPATAQPALAAGG